MIKKKDRKCESIEEFLARGGQIEKVPAVVQEDKTVTVNRTTNGPVTILTLAEADLLYGEKSEHQKREKKISKKVNLSVLSPDLLAKLGLSVEKKDDDASKA